MSIFHQGENLGSSFFCMRSVSHAKNRDKKWLLYNGFPSESINIKGFFYISNNRSTFKEIHSEQLFLDFEENGENPVLIYVCHIKAPLYTKLTLMDCGIGNTNLLGASSSGLGYDCFYMKSTDGATMYFNLGSGIGSGRFQTDY